MDRLKIEKELLRLANPKKEKILGRFFKTGEGEYGEGDIFLGLTVPQQRQIAKKYSPLTLKEIQKLLSSKIHEHRSIALLILIIQYQRAEESEKRQIFDFYLANAKNINNWDLVDLSAPTIAGDYLLDKDKRVLYKLARSKNLWERRISIISTYTFIRNGRFEETLKIAEILLKDEHDLIHKATGWMLREIGKKNQEVEEQFLRKNCRQMPRIMLRYAVEKFSEQKRKLYLSKNGMKSAMNNSGTTNLA